MNAYAPILVLGGIATAFAVLSVILASAVGPSRHNRAKLDAYECGIDPTPQTQGGARSGVGPRIPIKFYLTAMLFIIFDIEIVFLYPWAVHFDTLGVFGFTAMTIFIFNVSIAYAYEWRRGGLSWA